jgi:nucleoside-diphosphate-sugar epimerase
MQRILVTGATGFTGGHLTRRLRAEGHRVVALVRATSRTEALRALGVETVVADLADREAVRRAVAGAEVVFHVAAAYRTEHADMDEFRRVNVDGTAHLLEAARTEGVARFVHCSTVGVQGEITHPPADEDYRFEPGDHYQDSKAAGERLARVAFAEGLPGTVVRPVGIYGPGDRRFLKLFRGIDRGRFVMIGRGEVLYHMTHVDDLVDGFLLASRRPEALGEVFTIGGPEYTTVRELVDRLAELLGRPRPRLRVPLAPARLAAVLCEGICRPLGIAPPLYPRRLDFFTKGRAFTIDKARRLLGYEPKIGLDQGLGSTAAWYREQGWM